MSITPESGQTQAPAPRSAERRRRQQSLVWGHGWGRAGEAVDRAGEHDSSRGRHTHRNRGLPFLLVVTLGVLTWVGVTKVRTRSRVLEFGQQITALTAERAQLLDIRRRLETERAFLRHPDRIRDEATERFSMIPAPPERIQQITLSAARKKSASP